MSSESTAIFIPIIDALHNHQVIAYPTEAVFGLGCDPDSEQAVNALLALKQRPWEKGLILIAADYAQLTPYIDDTVLSEQQRATMFASWPGPVTWVIPARSETPRLLTGRFNSLAVRVSDHPLVQQLCRQFGKPLVSTSANLSGQEPCRSADEVQQQFGAAFPVLTGSVGGRLNPSEIRDVLTGKQIRQG
ncbi:L-threonylcarbamoyladenylate synthase type 1 TsaC [Serratia proteamaculans]|jgi:L-threonylcarbamoyladenylate synthase|uniref:L-threonylcarbamoyladenylate synthase type 1 TsaC n=1 Tax=Serratia TaxID=613 RepID=UPI000BFFA2CE|nr:MULTISPECIES: L-threonylcarbamoyladenylate synthase type 1 TsaC [Serratia]CAI1176327.1 t(6)A37 threonylcarbamoyladenosine biosynthesis protein RimN [Serratia proteamaculans]CAI1944844.1 t(6)A37 threonylcarbamoyladenosine biosynthesis protein RimN [Serratia proteamaculans]CAI1955953.1 t(6)A37 threonylcarbamoyladenosine biosynthesis protein RimN [Serratia proteamaculans]CAI1985055.1 t(6)A37 threonylcarbamoyladenosine biosynthesis protein RimN [Serratia proteamaculans]CAI2538697.1 t(6)A37 thre